MSALEHTAMPVAFHDYDTDFVLTAEQARAVLNTLAELEDNR